MPEEHAFLSASGSHRWLECPPSAMMEKDFPSTSSPAAEEGTQSHKMAEMKLKDGKKDGIRGYEFIGVDFDEMNKYTDDYVDYCHAARDDFDFVTGGEFSERIEQRLDLSKYVPGSFGTADYLLVSLDEIRVIDLKYGKGVKVDVVNNPQLMLYALGAIEYAQNNIFGLNVYLDDDEVTMCIYQPRLDNIKEFTMSVRDLKAWGSGIIGLAEQAFKGEGVLKVGEHCRWCSAKSICRAYGAESVALAKADKKSLKMMTDDEIEPLLPQLDEFVKWAESLKKYALERATAGKKWEGMKLVEGRCSRKFTESDEHIKWVLDAIKPEVDFTRLETLTNIEKKLGKEVFKDEFGSMIKRVPGKPTLVPESDKRRELKTGEELDMLDIEF
jgi:Protein of unknown function (DUF2800)